MISSVLMVDCNPEFNLKNSIKANDVHEFMYFQKIFTNDDGTTTITAVVMGESNVIKRILYQYMHAVTHIDYAIKKEFKSVAEVKEQLDDLYVKSLDKNGELDDFYFISNIRTSHRIGLIREKREIHNNSRKKLGSRNRRTVASLNRGNFVYDNYMNPADESIRITQCDLLIELIDHVKTCKKSDCDRVSYLLEC